MSEQFTEKKENKWNQKNKSSVALADKRMFFLYQISRHSLPYQS